MSTRNNDSDPLFTPKRAAPQPLSGSDHEAYIRIVQDAWRTGLPALKRVVDLDEQRWLAMLFVWLDPGNKQRAETGKRLIRALDQIIGTLRPEHDRGWKNLAEAPSVALPALLCALQLGDDSQDALGRDPLSALEHAETPAKKRRKKQKPFAKRQAPEGLPAQYLYTDAQLLEANRLLQTDLYTTSEVARRMNMPRHYISTLKTGNNPRLLRLLSAQNAAPTDPDAEQAAE